jgi:phosphomevalonate kinase
MQPDPFTIELPSKVMLAGEYSVLSPGGEALALGTGNGFIVTCRPTDRPRISLPDLELHQRLPYTPDMSTPSALSFVAAILTSLSSHTGRQWPCFHLEIRRHQEALNVGASASLVVGTALAVNRWCDLQLPVPILGRLCSEAHRRVQGTGSGYDVMTILAGGLVRFKSQTASYFQRSKLKTGEVVAAFCGQIADTRTQVERFLLWRRSSPDAGSLMQAHEVNSQQLITDLWEHGVTLQTGALVSATEETLRRIADSGGLELFTPEIEHLLALSRTNGIPARISGAGGGDIVIGLCDDPARARALRTVWSSAGYRIG